MEEQQETQQKSFFEKLGEVLNKPLPGTEAKPKAPAEISEGDDDSLLARIKDILNTPLPGSEKLNQQLDPEISKTASAEEIPAVVEPEVSEADFQENWWDIDWAEFKAHQAQDRKGLNMKQRQDQEGFAQYQEQERFQFEMYQAKEFEIFQHQQQAKMNWIQNQQLAADAGEQPVQYGMVPPPPPIAPLPPQMPVPPWVKAPDDSSNTA